MAASGRLGFGAKIAALVISLTLAMGIAVSLVAERILAKALEDEFVSKGTSIVRSLSISAEEYLTSDQRTALQGKIEQFRSASGVRYIVVLGKDGETVNHTLSPSFPPALGAALQAHGSSADPDDEVHITRISDVSEVGKVLNISRPILLGILGTIHVGMDMQIIDAEVRRAIGSLVLVCLVFAVAGVALSFAAGRMLARPIRDLVRATREVADGGLDTRTHEQTRNEFPTLSDGFDAMVQSLRSIAEGMRRGSDDVSTTAKAILASSQTQQLGIAEQTANIAEVTQSMQALSGTADAITNEATQLSSLGEHMSEQMKVAQQAVDTTRTTIVTAAERSDGVAKQVLQLYEQSRSIIGVVDIIDAISDRLDLLALNAALEGARAGELGKGFALVAQEMRRLAENVTTGTREVKETLELVQSAARVAASASEESAAATRDGVREVESVITVTREMFALISRAAQASQQIRTITQKQRASAAEVASTMGEIGSVSMDARSLSQEVTSSANELVAVADALREQTQRFRIKA